MNKTVMVCSWLDVANRNRSGSFFFDQRDALAAHLKCDMYARTKGGFWGLIFHSRDGYKVLEFRVPRFTQRGLTSFGLSFTM